MKALLVFSALIFSQNLLAWGERGHHIIGEAAARLVERELQAHPDRNKLGRFFRHRALQMGHLNNVPDISWKSQKTPEIKTHNGPSHYFDVEHLLGFPKKTSERSYLQKIRDFPEDYKELRKMAKGKEHPLKKRPLDVYQDTGSAPWRVGDLYKRALELMKCTSERQGSAFTTPLFPLSGQFVVDKTGCKKHTERLEALLGSVILMGLMGHFVADLSQPQHNSADYDGWLTGQGGLHSYFETLLILGAGDDLMYLVSERAKRLKSRNILARRLGPDWQNLSPTKLMLRLSADAFSNLNKLQELDRKYSLIEESRREKGNKIKARRVDPHTPKVWRRYKSFAVDRMAMSTAVLSHLWVKIWIEGGRPDIADIVFYTKPYPLDSAFILPAYR